MDCVTGPLLFIARFLPHFIYKITQNASNRDKETHN